MRQDQGEAPSSQAAVPPTTVLGRRLPGVLSRAVSSRAFLLLALLLAVALVSWGQYSVGNGRELFRWPFQGVLAHQFDRAFGGPNALDFAAPLFVIGAAIFAYAGLRIPDRHDFHWSDAIGHRLSRVLLLGFAIGVGASLWLALRLFQGHYHPNYRWVFFSALILLTLLTAAVDWRRGLFRGFKLRPAHALEILAVAAIVGTFIGINVHDLDSWRYAAIGDESTILAVAERILDDNGLNWFSQRDGPLAIIPVLGSLWHSGNLLIFGRDLFGWKMAGITSVALTLPVFYWLLRDLFGQRTAIFGTLFLAASHYIFAYVHTGYPNILPLLPTAAALACLVSGMRRNSYSLFFLSGVFAGAGFYTFHSSRAIIIMLVAALLLVRDRRLQRDALIWLIPGFVLMVLPLFATERWEVIDAMQERSALDSGQPLFQHLADNLIRSVFAFSFNPTKGPYTAGALMDGVSVALAIAGLGLAVARIKEFSYRLLLIWFAVAVVTTGMFSEYTFVSISRLHYVLPPLAGFAGITVDRLIASFGELKPGIRLTAPVLSGVALAALAPTVFILNGRQFFIYSADHYPTIAETVILRELEDPACKDQPLRNIVYMPNPDPVMNLQMRFMPAEERPIQIAAEEIASTFSGYSPPEGTGCLIIGPTQDVQLAPFVARLPGAQIVTDVSGETTVAVLHPVASQAPTSEQLAAAWRTQFASDDQLAGVSRVRERDVLPAIDAPAFVPAAQAPLNAPEPALAVEVAGELRGYPLRYLAWHGVVNDIIRGTPIVITYDPISDTARAFRRNIGGQVYSFGTSGLMRDGNALIYDRETESWWQQISGLAVAGTLAGQELSPVPAAVLTIQQIVSIDFSATALAVPPDDPRYLRNPLLSYDVPEAKPVFVRQATDPRLPPLQRVLVIDVGDRLVAIPVPARRGELETETSTIDIDGREIHLVFDSRTLSSLNARQIQDSRAAGSLVALGASASGAGTRWTLLAAPGAPPQAESLAPLTQFSAFWFAVAANYPGIELLTLE